MIFFKSKKILIFISVLTISSLGFISYLYLLPQKNNTEDITRQTLKTLGLNETYLSKPQKNGNLTIYQDIALDKERISSIKKIAIQAPSLQDFLTVGVENITIDGISLIGEWDVETPGFIKFSGWSPPAKIESISKLPLQSLRLSNTEISLLTKNMGAITLNFDFESTLHDGKMSFQSSLKSAQKFISFTANAEGIIAKNYLNAEIGIDNGKFEVPEAAIRVSRAHGSINISRDISGDQKIIGEINAGGISLMGIPWQNAVATLDLRNDTRTIFAEAKSIGVEGIELSLTLAQEKDTPPTLSGHIHAEDGRSLADYLTQQTQITFPATDLETIKSMKAVGIDFFLEDLGSEQKIRYTIQPEESAPDNDDPHQH
ncbi:MAG: hypothetical protein WBK77_00305 [Alphaproteobacteria bacterium]